MGRKNFLGPGGFIDLEFYILIFDAVYPLVYLFNLGYTAKKL